MHTKWTALHICCRSNHIPADETGALALYPTRPCPWCTGITVLLLSSFQGTRLGPLACINALPYNIMRPYPWDSSAPTGIADFIFHLEALVNHSIIADQKRVFICRKWMKVMTLEQSFCRQPSFASKETKKKGQESKLPLTFEHLKKLWNFSAFSYKHIFSCRCLNFYIWAFLLILNM